MRTPARPRLPDGDCVFISDNRIIAGANLRMLIAGGLDGDEVDNQGRVKNGNATPDFD